MKNKEKWVQILGEEYFSSSVYREEPILRTAATMKNYMPQQYRDMRRLALQNGAQRQSHEEIFYRQAKFMESFEDDYDYGGTFFRYFPTYQSMSDMQLRGYFSWRTQVRRGNIQITSLSFVFIYLYELINCIGSASPADGYARLAAFSDAYCALDIHIHRYTQLWMRDFVLWYGLDTSFLADHFDLPAERAMAVLSDYAHAPDEELFSAVCACSSYNPEHSRFYRTCPEDVRAVACKAFRVWADYYAKGRKSTLFEALFGKPYTTPYTMFSSAVFWQKEKHADTDIVIGPYTSFSCRDGKWTYTKLWSNADPRRTIGLFLRTVDAMMRDANAYPHPLKCSKTPKYQQKIIGECIRSCREEKERQEARIVRIDLSKLQGIRAAADSTRDKLIVEEVSEEMQDEPAAVPESPKAERPFDLTETEYAVLYALLYGEDAQKPLKGKGLLLSVVTDSINEKCFDEFADTVLVFDGDTPCVLEDYADELKGIIV